MFNNNLCKQYQQEGNYTKLDFNIWDTMSTRCTAVCFVDSSSRGDSPLRHLGHFVPTI